MKKPLIGLALWNAPQEKVILPIPQLIVSFENPQFPTFEFKNWRPGISMGTIERTSQFMIRAAQQEFAKMQQALRTEEAKAKTTTAESALTT